MSIDEIVSAAARRTQQAVIETTDLAGGYDDLLAIRSRRARASIAVAGAAVAALLVAVWFGTSGMGAHRTEPAGPNPQHSKPFLGAPPLCGSGGLASNYQTAVAVGPCATTPGRYLSLLQGFLTTRPFAFTLPPGWRLTGLPGVFAGSPSQSGTGGLLMESDRTGDSIAIVMLPTELQPKGKRRNTLGDTAEQVAEWLSARPALSASPVVNMVINQISAKQVDLTLRLYQPHSNTCVNGDECAGVFDVVEDRRPSPGVLGVVPGKSSRALLFNPVGSGSPVVIWIWSHSSTSATLDQPDNEVHAILNSVDLDPTIP
jgi:hypothetical protein